MPKIVAVLNDLMFTVKIQEAAKRARLEAVFVKSQKKALECAKEKPAGLVLDLNYTEAEPLTLISALKASKETQDVPVLGYVSHVQVDLRQAAQDRGCDVVVARSAFVQNLPELLEQFCQTKSTFGSSPR
jgi:PleD family two-component response regulator